MLREIADIRQIEGEPRRRWFEDDLFELVVWFGADDRVTGFQLCYDIKEDERALTWFAESGYSHDRIDSGESEPKQAKASPVLLRAAGFDKSHILGKFKIASRNLNPELVRTLIKRIENCPL